MKKGISILTFVSLLLSFCSCGNSSDSSNSQVSDSSTAEVTSAAVPESTQEPESTSEVIFHGSYTAQKPTEPITMINHMTDYERACVIKRPFSLLDEQLPEPEVMIGNINVSKETTIALYDEWLKTGRMTEEEYKEATAEASDYSYRSALINGVPYNLFIPPDGYDGGKLVLDEETSFDNKEAFIDSIVMDYCKNNRYDQTKTDSIIRQTNTVFDAVINDTYTKLSDTYEKYDLPFYNAANDPYADFRSSWEFNSDALAEIKDFTEEYLVYDEQLGLDFLVHVTLPPEYDKSKSYPVLFMTDGVWRLNDHAALYKAMKQKEAANVILVSLAYSYNIKGTEDQLRDRLFIHEREKLLSFITDDLMPFLGENYSIDYADSTLFGHSMAGVFSHYACFKSDSYENQPFFRYIIGSPAMFNLYGIDTDYDAAAAESEYGYFDRHDSLDKKLLLCGGSQEDSDYSDAYHGHDSLLTGLNKIKDRLSVQKTDFTYKLYESHHYQYVSSMLLEFLKTEYPAE